ncbi:hypothetical protein HMPREF0591_0997 [Mycobacterium parascrofulaceum ATCC BAA-614]|jgi:predicted ATP-grasp superfamily ATP-dependent carboligase|uniref:FAD-dependent pyridine nucleotide-disulfide oxidoreductase n=1 Tax=Mycobacterium parascrofulaceum ATCC BAA-614 TaxID=525368 RepID=D5P4A3_9MYCO|nr:MULTISPECIES: hypothetical protein [Mycobacterium]EFG79100.1 hypothetical protein HMPREF0591_0997 [Mycobacterium parascrofulaceum ATCC BAA-614]OCB31375.1 hypothetical protein A9X02_25360 [Mycobacterium malmoense]
MTVSADDVRRLLDSHDERAVLVAIEGRVDVASPAELDTADYRGALQIATRQEVLERAGGAQLSERELAEQAEELDTALRNLGA